MQGRHVTPASANNFIANRFKHLGRPTGRSGNIGRRLFIHVKDRITRGRVYSRIGNLLILATTISTGGFTIRTGPIRSLSNVVHVLFELRLSGTMTLIYLNSSIPKGISVRGKANLRR